MNKEAQMQSHELSLGFTTLDCNQQEGNPLIFLNYVNPDHRLALPSPKGDWYLVNTAVAAVRAGERVLCSKLIDGLYGYYKQLGLIPEGASIIQVEPQVDGDINYAYPATDPLTILDEQIYFTNGDKPLVSAITFTCKRVGYQEQNLGLKSLDRLSSFQTNNKALFRNASFEYGYRMLPGECLSSWEDLERAAQTYGGLEYGVWLKFPTGSGGDLVYHTNRASIELLCEGVNRIRDNVVSALSQGKFATDRELFWPEKEFCPEDFLLVVESDARNCGEVLVNGSTQFITRKDRGLSVIGHFQQITTEQGEYLGNRSFNSTEAVEELLVEQVTRVAEYSRCANQYYGIQGVDWFLVRDKAGKIEPYVVELNSRPTANTPPAIMAAKLGAEHWVNTNLYTDRPIIDIGDYLDVIGRDLALGNIEEGLVIPQSFRTLVTRRKVFPSPDFKVLILGTSSDHCNQIIDKLRHRSIRFTPE